MTARPPAPLARTLTRMNLLVSATALLLACAGFIAFDLATSGETIGRNLSIQAQIVGANSVSAVLFDDVQAGRDTLASLEASPDITAAYIYDDGGRLFVSYFRDGRGIAPPAAPVLEAATVETGAFSWDQFVLTRRIIFQGERAGTVVIHSSLRALYARLELSLIIAGTVLLVSLLTALLVSRVHQRAISQPLIALAGVARQVSRSERRDELRAAAAPGAAEEIAILIASFNDMLGGLDARDRALQQAHDGLEQRVRQRTAELHATNHELESFSYSVSHDLRAPLRHVVGFATLLQKNAGAALSARDVRHLQTITDSANRMAKLIDDLLAFSRMGRASLNPRRMDLAEIVRGVQAELDEDATRDGRTIAWNVHPLPEVFADPALLRPVMMNLLSNSVKYTATREVARIEVGELPHENGEQIVFVRDNGVGFDMQYVHKLFGVFQRLHRNEEFPGTGIGLANVRRIISRHGGRTWAEGALDAGATFFFSLPIAADADRSEPQTTAPSAA